MTLSRRTMFKHMLAGMLTLPAWMPRLAFSPRYQNPQGDILVCVFLRGGADGLNMVVPYGEEAYYQARPQLAIPRPDDSRASLKALDLDGFFGLHPALSPLHPIFQAGECLAIHATGSPDPTRSHFDAMDYMERGTPGEKKLNSGWIGRHIASLTTENSSPVRAIGWGTAAQQSLRGPVAPVALQSIADYHLGGRVEAATAILNTLDSLYALDSEELYATAKATQDALHVIGSVDINNYRPQNSAIYPESDLAFSLLQTAALVRADVGLEVACIDLGGWDTHANQGNVEGEQAGLMQTLAEGLAAFHLDMGMDMSRVTVVVMSEFGRRVQENANQGTDHGHGNMMLVMSGHLATTGLPVYANWPGLQADALDRGDLAVTTDYRDVLSELVKIYLCNEAGDIFPNYIPTLPGIFRA